MAREKVTTLYSRNGIRILKTENIQPGYKKPQWLFDEKSREEFLENIAYNKEHGEYVEIKHESPLGFYYYTREWKKYNTTDKKPKSVTYKKYIIYLDSKKYELEFPTSYYSNGTKQAINIDMRPWDILPGYKGMPDNMIKVLVQETNKFLDILFEYKNYIQMNSDPNIYKKRIMIELFGYEDGPKVQPNDIKILSHGFDLKQSFRKRKET